jgi:hypothetical protein
MAGLLCTQRTTFTQISIFSQHFLSSVGIQKHFMVAEIPGFELPNWLSGPTTSLFSRDGIGKLMFNKVK